MVFLDLFEGIAAVDGRTDDLKIRLGFEGGGQDFPHKCGIVSDEDSDHPAPPLERYKVPLMPLAMALRCTEKRYRTI